MTTSDTPVAVVTGAAQGIGAAIARRLSHDGFGVALLDLQADAVQDLAKELSADGREAIALSCDVSSPDQVSSAFAAVGEKWQRVDVLASNAGITRDHMFHKMPPEDWDAVIATHLRGGYLVAQAAQRFMVSQRSGSIIFISSRAATGNRGQSNYSAAKAGLEGLTKTLAIELGPFGVTVNAIAPGFIDSPMTRAVEQRSGRSWDEIATDVLARNYIKRLGRPEDIAGVVSFLASPDASYLTGQVLQVGGR
jgi:3-oxoacyl-[acyl-carrier protein] reductase